jgi:hypothetical protein
MFRKKAELLTLEELRAAFDEPEAVFAARSAPIAVGIGIGAVIVGVGIFLVYRILSTDDHGLMIGYALTLACFAAMWLWWLRSCLTLQIWVYPDVILFVRGPRGAVVSWDSVVQVQQRSDNTVILTRDDGAAAAYHPDIVRGGAKLTARIRSQAEARDIPWIGKETAN